MENHECHDCGKIIEPDRELRFYPGEDISVEGIRFLCEACADRRRAALKSDPFYFDCGDTGGQKMTWDKNAIAQIKLPDPADTDPHPRLRVKGEGISSGRSFFALMPDGWKLITLESRWEITGAACWYITDPDYRDICPVGLFVRDDMIIC